MDGANLSAVKQENVKQNSTGVERKSSPLVEIKSEVIEQPEVKEELFDSLKDEPVEFDVSGEKEPELTIDMPAKSIIEACKCVESRGRLPLGDLCLVNFFF